MSEKEIKTIKELEKLTRIKIPKNQRKQLQEVLEKYPVKFTAYLLKLIKKSPSIAKQFIPSVDELRTVGISRPWLGKAETGIYGLERMYTDRCIIKKRDV